MHDDRFTPHLVPGEELRWVGAPKPGFRLGRSDLVTFAFGTAVLALGASFAFGGTALIGVPLVVVGALLGPVRPFIERVRHAHTAYAVTSTRAMILRGRRHRRVEVINLFVRPHVDRVANYDGTTTIVLGGVASGRTFPFTSRRSAGPAFEYLVDAADAEAAIDDALAGRMPG